MVSRQLLGVRRYFPSLRHVTYDSEPRPAVSVAALLYDLPALHL
jgi:hypothetical protein